MNKYLLPLGFAVLAILTPIKAALMAAAGLVLIDLASGLLAARKQQIPITSQGLKRTLIKLFVYELVIILAFIVQTFLTGEVIPLIKILAGYVGIVELKSVLENLEIITGIPILKTLIDRLAKAADQS